MIVSAKEFDMNKDHPDPHVNALFYMARKCGWSPTSSRPAYMFIMDKLQPEERLISYETLQERVNELLSSLRAIKERSKNHEEAKHIAAITLDGDSILWGDQPLPQGGSS